MSRKTKIVEVPEFPKCDNRDQGKLFLITEWNAVDADRWIQRVAYAILNTGGSLPMDLRGAGWEGIAIMGINAVFRGNIDPDIMIPLCEQLLECVQIIPDKKFPEKSARPAVAPNDIEEVLTRYWLRDQVVSVHTNFSMADALSRLASQIMEKAPTKDSLNTKTSAPGSDI
jgi:hypothetical protein